MPLQVTEQPPTGRQQPLQIVLDKAFPAHPSFAYWMEVVVNDTLRIHPQGVVLALPAAITAVRNLRLHYYYCPYRTATVPAIPEGTKWVFTRRYDVQDPSTRSFQIVTPFVDAKIFNFVDFWKTAIRFRGRQLVWKERDRRFDFTDHPNGITLPDLAP